MLSSIGRSAIRRIGAGQSYASCARIGEWPRQAQRVYTAFSSYDVTELQSRADAPYVHFFRRTYATASKSTRVKKASLIGKPATARKSATKKAAKKPKAKPKKKKEKIARKAKPRVKKLLTEAQKKKRAEVQARADLKALKATALLSTPKALPVTAWTVLLTENLKSQSGQGSFELVRSVADVSARYKNLNPSDREHYNHIANQNKLANQASFKEWVENHTPDQIRAANLARRSLRRKLSKKGSKAYMPIEDSRIPKRPVTALLTFTKERWASGDLKGISFIEATKSLRSEWTNLSASEKKYFADLAATDKTRYAQEYKAVFHRDPPSHQEASQ